MNIPKAKSATKVLARFKNALPTAKSDLQHDFVPLNRFFYRSIIFFENL